MKNTHIEALVYFDEADFKTKLERIYAQIGEGTCLGCTKCCSESVNTFFCEYLNVRKTLMIQGELEVFQKACVVYYLTELVQPMKCPLLKVDGRCAVYYARPLPCRVFGHLEQEAYESNYQEILESNQQMALALKEELQIIVPETVISKKIAYCEDFKTTKVLTADDRDDLVDLLFSLDSQMLSQELISFDDVNLSLVQWFAYDLLGRASAEQLRIQVSQEISAKGESESLTKILNSL